MQSYMNMTMFKKNKKKRKLKTKIIYLLFGLFVVCVFIGAGYLNYLLKDLPDIKEIDNYSPSLTTKIYSRDDRLFAQFAVEKRTLVSLSYIPEALKSAIIAVEDSHFYEHHGIDFMGIMRAMLKNIKAGGFVEGGSTITQQLARVLFLNPRKTITRKLREALLALKIENNYSKGDILELYLNQVYLAHGAYGVEAAAHAYFDKSVKSLNLAECAMIAGLPKAPNNYSPIRHPERAKKRRKHVLDRMLIEGFINEKQHEQAINQEFVLKESSGKNQAPYFTEYIRRQLEQKYGSTVLYRSGRKVYTTLDLRLQNFAQDAIAWGVEELDHRQGYRLIKENTKINPHFIADKSLDELKINDKYLASVENVTSDEIFLRVGNCFGRLPKENMNWLRSKPEVLFKTDDQILVKVLGIEYNGEQKKYLFSLYQTPKPQGAMVVLDPATGYILAMVGGYDFSTSKFNRAIQARRQPGSAFKPIIYTTSLLYGTTLADITLDTAVIYKDNSMDEEWKPVNYYERFYGPTTIRDALEHSRNVVTIKLLKKIGVKKVIKTARALGIKSPLVRDLSLALGSSGVNLLELTSVYGVFANDGLRKPPFSIRYVTDSKGKILEQNEKVEERVLDEKVAYLITSLLRGVVEHGTGRRAKQIGRELAGKTGTTNKYIDAWFMGYSPDIVAGVWVGMDNNTSMGHAETGSRAASPIWIRFMKEALMDKPIKDFVPPKGIIRASIDIASGLLATDKCKNIITEDFINGTQPHKLCDSHRPTIDKFLKVDLDLSEEEQLNEEELSKLEDMDSKEDYLEWVFD